MAEKVRIALKLLQSGMNPAEVAAITELSMQDLERLIILPA